MIINISIFFIITLQKKQHAHLNITLPKHIYTQIDRYRKTKTKTTTYITNTTKQQQQQKQQKQNVYDQNFFEKQ